MNASTSSFYHFLRDQANKKIQTQPGYFCVTLCSALIAPKCLATRQRGVQDSSASASMPSTRMFCFQMLTITIAVLRYVR